MYEDCIWHGVEESISAIPFHRETPVVRRQSLLSTGRGPDWGLHAAIHLVTVGSGGRPVRYCDGHVHGAAEFLILASEAALVFEVTIGGEVHLVSAPAIVRVPAGVPHAVNAVTGSGVLVVLVEDQAYTAVEPPEQR